MSELLRSIEYPGKVRFEIARGDLTQEPVDAIVNAANAMLQHGGGIARAIVERGGREIQIASNEWVHNHGPVQHDQPAFTTAGKLKCRYVIHTVGPMGGEEDGDAKLAAAVNGSLRRASELGLESIGLPAISTGIFGFPKDRAARIIFTETDRFLRETTTTLKVIRLVLYDQATLEPFLRVWDERQWP